MKRNSLQIQAINDFLDPQDPGIKYVLIGEQSELDNQQDEQQQHDELDYALFQVGDKNYYQIRLTILFALQWTWQALLFLGSPFLFQVPNFLCDGMICTESNGGCKKQILNPSFQHFTITTQFQLYCDKSNERDIAQSVIFAGGIVGVLVSSFFSDNFGRKNTVAILWFISSIFLLQMAFVNSYFYLLITLFMSAFGVMGSSNLHFVILNEQAGEMFRQRAIICLMLAYAIGGIFKAIISDFFYDWRNEVFYIYGLGSFVLNLTYFIMVESPKFLITKLNKNESIQQSLYYIARTNRRNVQIQQQFKENKNQEILYWYYDLIRYKSLRNITISCCLNMFAAQMIYYGIQYSLPNLGFSLKINTIFVQIFEIIGCLLMQLIITKTPRKIFSFIGMLITSLVCMQFIFIKIPKECELDTQFCSEKILQLLLASLAKLLIAALFCLIQIYYPELYPTTVRSLGVGMTFSVGLIGSVLVPFVVTDCLQNNINPLVIIGLIGSIGSTTFLILDETLNKKLQQNIIELS